MKEKQNVETETDESRKQWRTSTAVTKLTHGFLIFGGDPRKAVIFSIISEHRHKHCRLLLIYTRPQMFSLP